MNLLERCAGERKALESVPNSLFYQKLIETERAAYAVRQHLFSSLYDRLSTRPFLDNIEKKWIAFQLLKGLADIHGRQASIPVSDGHFPASHRLLVPPSSRSVTEISSPKT